MTQEERLFVALMIGAFVFGPIVGHVAAYLLLRRRRR